MTQFIEGFDRQQTMLLPEHLDDYVDENSPVRAIDAFQKRRHRDGIACARLQHDPRDEDHGYFGDDRRDEGVRYLVHPEIRAPIDQSVSGGHCQPHNPSFPPK